MAQRPTISIDTIRNLCNIINNGSENSFDLVIDQMMAALRLDLNHGWSTSSNEYLEHVCCMLIIELNK